MSEKDKIVTILIVLGLAFISVGIYTQVYSVPISEWPFYFDWPRPPLLTYPHREKASPHVLLGIILIILGVIIRHVGGGKQIDRSKEE